jgi:hypothetical protein
METFEFCPNRMVPETLARDTPDGMSLGGWQFTARPTTPFQRRFRITLYGLKWFLDPETDEYDIVEEPEFNARLLELFYQAHETWNPFIFPHPHLGDIVVRFLSPVSVPKGIKDGGGLIDAFEITLVEHNPGYAA